MLRTGSDADLQDNPPLWRQVWNRFRAELLPGWIAERPGTRPRPWWLFDCPAGCEPRDDETRPEFLHRIGEIDDEELRLMWAQALAVLKHNAIPHELPAAWERRSDQFHCDDDVPYTDVHKFAISHPIDGLTDEEARLVAELGPQVLAATDDREYESDDDDDTP